MSTESTQRHVLVVDDEPLVCETVSMLLEMEGHRVGRAASGGEALLAFEPGKFHVVFTDFSMPGMTGAELAFAIKSRAPDQPVVLLTGHAERFQDSEQRCAAIDDVIEKPIAVESLRAVITRFSRT